MSDLNTTTGAINVTTTTMNFNATTEVINSTTTIAIIPPTVSSSSSLDWRNTVAYVCFGVGAFMLIVAVLMIIGIIVVRRRQRNAKSQVQRSLYLYDYNLTGNGFPFPLATISDIERVTQIDRSNPIPNPEDVFNGRRNPYNGFLLPSKKITSGIPTSRKDAPDYNLSGDEYPFPLSIISGKDSLTMRHSMGRLNPAFHPSNESLSGNSSRSSAADEMSAFAGESSDNSYVKLHRSSPLAGINAVYSSSGELTSHDDTNLRQNARVKGHFADRTNGFKQKRVSDVIASDVISPLGRRQSSKAKVDPDFSPRREKRLTNEYVDRPSGRFGVVNEGFIPDHDILPRTTFSSISRSNSSRSRLSDVIGLTIDERNKPTRVDHLNRNVGHDGGLGVLLSNIEKRAGVYHVSLRHNGEAVTQSKIVKQPA